MKKIWCLLLALAMVMSFAACEEDDDSNSSGRKKKRQESTQITETQETIPQETEDRTNPPEEETTQPQVDVTQYLQEVLENQRYFITQEQSKAFLTDYTVDVLQSPVTAYAYVDMDEDGTDELLLRLNSKDHYILLLRYFDGAVYGHAFGARQMSTIHTNGVFYASNGAAYTIMLRLRFNGSQLKEDTVAYGDGEKAEYIIDGTPCTKEDFDVFVRQQNSVPYVQWTELRQPEAGKEPETPSSSYTLNIRRLNLPIFNEPSEDGTVVDVVYTQGVYTIVDEKVDEYGTHWGKLKSGLGWVDVQEAVKNVPAAVSYPFDTLKNRYPVIKSVYIDDMLEVYIFVNKTVTEFSVVQVDGCWDNPYIQKTYETIGTVNSDEAVSIHMGFYGDVQQSNVGISFKDANGLTRCFYITDSGLNNELYLIEVQI